MSTNASPTRVQALAAGSILVGISALGLKYVAYLVTGSVALYSDAIETVANVATALATFLAVRISAKPADANHPFGHSKVEYFAAVFEGVVIILAAVAILREAWLGFAHPREPVAPLRGLLINSAASVLNAVWSWVLIRQGRAHRSPALVADGRHLLTDLWTSAGVIAGVLLIALTGWRPLDPIIAAIVAVNVIWAGWGLGKESVDGLMDKALPPDQLARVQAVIQQAMTGALEAHRIRTRQAGRTTFIDFDLVVDADMTVGDAHAICDRIEDGLHHTFPDASISIHVEPPQKREGAFGDVLLMRGDAG